MLYPTELMAHLGDPVPGTALPLRDGAGDGNRTHAASLEGWNSTIELHPHGVDQNRLTIIPQFSPLVKGFAKFFLSLWINGAIRAIMKPSQLWEAI